MPVQVVSRNHATDTPHKPNLRIEYDLHQNKRNNMCVYELVVRVWFFWNVVTNDNCDITPVREVPRNHATDTPHKPNLRLEYDLHQNKRNKMFVYERACKSVVLRECDYLDYLVIK